MIEVKNLAYVFPDQTVGIHPTTFTLPTGSRTLLIGPNGAGKSTILKVLAGKTLAKAGAVFIGGKDPFRDGDLSITYLGTEWAGNPIVRHDIPVVLLLSSIGGDTFPERRDLLVDILDIDLRWHMHAVSDGERRRVQLAMGLMRPWTTLLLDEVTVDLDVLVRARLLDFLRKETETRPCTIVYATHIFDGLSDWPTHLAHMHLGKVSDVHSHNLDEVESHSESLAPSSTESVTGKRVRRNGYLLELALEWLGKDLEERGVRAKKPKWEDIEKETFESMPLERNAEDGFAKYFRASRARD